MAFSEVYVTICWIQYFTKYHSTIIIFLFLFFFHCENGWNNIKVRFGNKLKGFASKRTGNVWKTLMEMQKRQILEQMTQRGKVLCGWIKTQMFLPVSACYLLNYFGIHKYIKKYVSGISWKKRCTQHDIFLKHSREALGLFWLDRTKQTGRNSILFFYNIC